MDCMALNRVDSLRHSVNIFKVTFPKPNNGNAKFFHVGILGYIQSHTFSLPFIWSWVSIFFAMPIITIKLYDGIIGWNESVNSKLIVDNMLTNKINASGNKDGIPKGFKFIGRFIFILVCANFKCMSLKCFTVISTIYRAIFLLKKYRGADKRAITNLTNQHNFISALVFIRAINATCNRFFSMNFRNVKNSIADYARFINSHPLPINPSVFQKAKVRAILNRFYARFINGDAAAYTIKTSHGIFHALMITQNPIKLYKWLFAAGIKRVEQSQKQSPLFAPAPPAIQQIQEGMFA